ncbi:hypothetical protein DV737_g3058, partial [Chaetothyriales sp. CBS 132003]
MANHALKNDLTSEDSILPKEKWSFGVLNDKYTEEVPGTVLLLASHRNEPLGMQHQRVPAAAKKRTADGKIILDPQPHDSPNDPLNWSKWRRDTALLCLGFYCMLGGGMTPVVAAGFNEIAQSFDVSFAQVTRTTGLFMLGLGIGGVFVSPTAILFGKRPVYLASSVMFIVFSIWCGVAPDYANLATARVFQGMSISPVEVLPSASIAEIFYLHERAFRIGIYTLLLLGGKNLIPLVSAAIIQSKGWRWVFYVVAMVVAFGGVLLFLFVPETVWDRTPRPKSRRPGMVRSLSDLVRMPSRPSRERGRRLPAPHDEEKSQDSEEAELGDTRPQPEAEAVLGVQGETGNVRPRLHVAFSSDAIGPHHETDPDSPEVGDVEKHADGNPGAAASPAPERVSPAPSVHYGRPSPEAENKTSALSPGPEDESRTIHIQRYTNRLVNSPPKTYVQTLKPWSGRLSHASWFKVALRPFILFTYPAVLWSALVYSLSIGWLIVLSESVAYIFGNRSLYHFSALGVGLVYLSPFIGGVIGTAVAGKLSDQIVKWMARRNGGVYEPEFRLVMGLPVALSTAIGLMGFGWSAQERDSFMVPTVFFGIISFGCALGSTTAITFCVDSYRQYAGEALVTLNLSKNILHGLLFSLFFANWLESDGPRKTFVALGCIQLVCLTTTVPMYLFGKRARMETVRRGWMEKY